MKRKVWWTTSDYFYHSPTELPDHYIRLGLRSEWLWNRDRELWFAFRDELNRRADGIR